MNIQQLINTFGNFIDKCAIRYPLVSNNKDKILDRCCHLYEDWQGLYFSNAEIFGRGMPKSHFTNYLGINSNEETENPRRFYAFITLRYNNARINTHTINDIVRALQFAKEIETENIPLYFLNGDNEYQLINLAIAETGLKLDNVYVEHIDQLQPHLEIYCNSTESEQELSEQLNLLYQFFFKFNEPEV